MNGSEINITHASEARTDELLQKLQDVAAFPVTNPTRSCIIL